MSDRDFLLENIDNLIEISEKIQEIDGEIMNLV